MRGPIDEANPQVCERTPPELEAVAAVQWWQGQADLDPLACPRDPNHAPLRPIFWTPPGHPREVRLWCGDCSITRGGVPQTVLDAFRARHVRWHLQTAKNALEAMTKAMEDPKAGLPVEHNIGMHDRIRLVEEHMEALAFEYDRYWREHLDPKRP